MRNRYLTVKGYGEQEIIIQKSRFIAYVNRAESEEEAQAFIQRIKKKNWDATHNCSAYLIGEFDQIQKANDDGEPAGTAGVPMLEVLKKRKMKDTVVVVTRYFGGIKLGAGGLVRAYSRAVSEGLDAAGIVERKPVTVHRVTIAYPWLGKVEKELRSSQFFIKDIHYLDRVQMDVYVDEGEEDTFSHWLTDLTNGQAVIEKGEALYIEREI